MFGCSKGDGTTFVNVCLSVYGAVCDKVVNMPSG